MSFNDPTPSDVVQPEGQGDGDATPGAPYQEFLDRIPEDARDVVEPVFKDWDANVTKKFQEHSQFRKEWEPLQETGIKDLSPDEVSWLVQFRQALEDPQIMQQWWEGYARENGLTVAEAQAQAADDDFGFQDPNQQVEKLLEEKLGPLMQRLEQHDGFFQQQTEAQRMAEAQNTINEQVAAIEKDHGSKLDDEQKQLLYQLAGAYVESDSDHAIQRGWADLQRWQNTWEKNTLQGKANQPAPAESGGVPDVNPPEHKRIDSPAVKNAAMEWVRNQSRA